MRKKNSKAKSYLYIKRIKKQEYLYLQKGKDTTIYLGNLQAIMESIGVGKKLKRFFYKRVKNNVYYYVELVNGEVKYLGSADKVLDAVKVDATGGDIISNMLKGIEGSAK